MEKIIYPEREVEEVPYEYDARYLLEVAFDGSNYGGWQIQSNAVTVQEVLQKLTGRLYDHQPISLIGSSRTDAGVHAIGFPATFLAPRRPSIPREKLKDAYNRLLPADIRVRQVLEVPLQFHARFDALGKAYTYVINLGDETPFSNRYSWHPRYSLDIEAIRRGAQYLIGTHDFSSFVCSRNDIDDAVRTIYRIEARMFGQYLCLTYVGNGFLYKMIRCLTGALAAVGGGKLPPEAIQTLLEAKNRSLAPTTASPCGLFLVKVFYDQAQLDNFQLENIPFSY